MRPITDALELLTAQHEEIDDLVIQVEFSYDSDAFDELADKLAAHLALEQELLYPVIAPTITGETLTEMLDEHVAIKRVLADMVWLGVADPEFGSRLRDLADLLAGHCSWQEDELFQTAAETLSTEQLTALSHRLHAFETQFPLAA